MRICLQEKDPLSGLFYDFHLLDLLVHHLYIALASQVPPPSEDMPAKGRRIQEGPAVVTHKLGRIP